MDNKRLKNIIAAGITAGAIGASVNANAAPISCSTVNDANSTTIYCTNNTGTTLTSDALDLTTLGYNLDDYSIKTEGGAWNENGNKNDSYHTFDPVNSFFNWYNGDILTTLLEYDTTSPDSMFYNRDMSQQPTNMATLTGYDSGGFTAGSSQFALPTSPVPVPPAAFLLASGLAGLSLFGRRKSNNDGR